MALFDKIEVKGTKVTHSVVEKELKPAPRKPSVVKPKHVDDINAQLQELAREGHGEPDFSYLSEGAPISEDDTETAVKRVAEMANMLRERAKAVVLAQVALDAANGEYARIAQQDFPDLLREVGLTKMELEDGTKLELKDDIRTSITELNKGKAFAWLRRYKLDGVIKSTLILAFDPGEDKKRQALYDQLVKKGLQPEAKDTVHPQTLKSLIKELRARELPPNATDDQRAMANPPADLFSIFPFSEVKLTEPRDAEPAPKPKKRK